MADVPAVAYDGGVAGLVATRPAAGEKFDARAQRVVDYSASLRGKQDQVLAAAGVTATPTHRMTTALNGFSVSLTLGQVERMRSQPGVLAVMEDAVQQAQTDASGSFLGLNGAGQAWATGLTGEGVVVGVIDSGIWPEHPSFADPGLKRPAGVADNLPCDFGKSAWNPADKPFRCQNKLLGARDMRAASKEIVGPGVYDSARDVDGHGTHTASVAAGNASVRASAFGASRGTVSGIAPRASIIVYKTLGESVSMQSDMAAAVDQAVVDGVDVINYSIGGRNTTFGPASIALFYATNSNVRVAVAAMNSGPQPGTISETAQAPWVTSVAASSHDRAFRSTITLGNGHTVRGASMTEGLSSRPLVDAAALGNASCVPWVPFTPAPTGKIVLCQSGGGSVESISKRLKGDGAAGLIYFKGNDSKTEMINNYWLPAVNVTRTDGLVLKAYLELAGGKGTAALSPGTADTARSSVIADFSSRGPNTSPGGEGILKPDVAAPGVEILGAQTPLPTTGSPGNLNPGPSRPGQLFQALSGTSQASPEVAGLMALQAQAHPGWSAAAVKSSLMTTARQNVVKEDGRTPATPFDMGAGHVNPGLYAAAGSMFNPGVVYDAGFLDYAGYVCGSPHNFFTAAYCQEVKASGRSLDAAQLNVPSFSEGSVAGSKSFRRTVTNVSGASLTLTAAAAAPPGYSVRIVPAQVTVAAGGKASFTVTVTRTTAAVGVWSFGSLTWKGSGFTVRSPIAVKSKA